MLARLNSYPPALFWLAGSCQHTIEKLSACSGCGLLQPADCFCPMTQEMCVYIFHSLTSWRGKKWQYLYTHSTEKTKTRNENTDSTLDQVLTTGQSTNLGLTLLQSSIWESKNLSYRNICICTQRCRYVLYSTVEIQKNLETI